MSGARFGMALGNCMGRSMEPARRRIGGRVRPLLVLAASASLATAALNSTQAAEEGDPKPDLSNNDYRLQLLDDPAPPLRPVEPRTEEDAARVDAMAWYMTGRLRQSRNEFRGAYEAYKRAVELDPDAVQIYRSLVPLAFSLNKEDEAVKYALKAVELDPQDYRLLRRLGVHMAGQRRLAEALRLLEKASQSPELDKTSGAYVTLMRDLALLYAATGQTEKAADSYEIVFDALRNRGNYDLDFRTRSALLSDPDTAYERMGQTFLEAGRHKLAIAAFERAARAKKGHPGTLSYNLARVYLETGQVEKARKELQKYFGAQLQSKGRDAYELLARILAEAGKTDELIPQLEKIAEQDPRNHTLQFYLAEQYVGGGRLKKAENLYTRVLEDAPSPEGYAGLAAVYRRRNKPAELLDALSKAVGEEGTLKYVQDELAKIGENDKLVKRLLEIGRTRAEDDSESAGYAESYVLGRLAAGADETEAAVTFYRNALQDRRDRAKALYNELGGYLLEARAFGEAAEVFEEAAADPALVDSRANYLFRLSQAREFNGETEKALSAVEEARKVFPDHPLLHYQKGWIYYHARRWDKAIEIFEQVIAKYTKQPRQQEIVRRCRFSLSNIYVQQGKIREGERILEQVLEESPDDPSVNNDLGYLYADQGKHLEKAETMIRKAVAAEPENAAYQDSMGWVLYKRGKFQEALPHLQKATKLPTGDDATIWEHLGDCYQRLQKTEQAREAWQKALKRAQEESRPDEELIERIQQKLKTGKGIAEVAGAGDET